MKKVLIVDDEATNFDYFVERCVAAVEVTFSKLQNVSSFNEATKLVESETPDIILLDAYYGVTCLGPKLASWLIQRHPEIQIIGNSSSPGIWKAVPGMLFSREKCGDEIIEMLRRMCAVQVTNSVQKQIPSKASAPTVTLGSSENVTHWDRIAIVRDSLTGEYELLFTFDQPEQWQRGLYENDDKRSRIITILQLELPKPYPIAPEQEAALEHLTKLLNDEWSYSQDCILILEKALHAVFMAGLEIGFETRVNQEQAPA